MSRITLVLSIAFAALGIILAPAASANTVSSTSTAYGSNYQASDEHRGPIISAKPTTKAPNSFGCGTPNGACTPQQWLKKKLQG